VRWVGGHLPYPAFGVPDRRARHVSRYLVAEIIDAFVEAFYTPEAVAQLRARAGGGEPDPSSFGGRLHDAAYPLVLRSQVLAARVRRTPAARKARRAGKRVRKQGVRVRLKAGAVVGKHIG
jgi:hypothetical protein